MRPTARIFHLQFGTDGGTERFFLRLTRAFAARGIKQGFGLREGTPLQDEIVKLGPVWSGYFLRRTPRALWQAARLRRAIRAFAPDAIMAWRAPAARLVPDLPGVAKIVRLGDYPRHLRHFSHLDSLVVNAPDIEAHCRSMGWQGRCTLISNFPADWTGSPVPRAEFGVPEGVPLVSFVGRFVPTKGADTLIRAVSEVPGLWLVLVGDGPERPALEALVQSLGIADRVRFAGWAQDAAAYIAASDIFCMPSRDEPLGNVMIEAWQVGRPVVTTATEGPSWFSKPEQDCLMVPVDDASAMAKALARLASDSDLRAGLARAAAETRSRRFAEDAVVAAYLDLFDNLRNGPTP
jgi:glycosyltransferase involved in cell wall biosynthesis